MTIQAVEKSVAAYRFLMRLYPAEHRAEYGPHMLQVFQDCCRDAYRRRQEKGIQDLWLGTLLDLVKSAGQTFSWLFQHSPCPAPRPS
ncbi:hypothetical protein GCM10008955_30620 [Deinococcus malanensis]|uniref:Uncharacterized protein n=2 Tax=Deinococcus malanensis TaxID=1706855 RepID=A0ABQ2EZ19_9DEIO|nr:hypothetical protein [Deinococcus malanensis]GGK34475.1 hypothetical protein GCM10008955_30620 [Deinococcus malanensis]